MTPSIHLPLVETFTKPYEAWRTRPPTKEEMMVNRSPTHIKEELIARISDSRTAAVYMADVRVDNALRSHVQNALEESPEYRAWQNAMPSKTPAAISLYQKDIKNSCMDAVSEEIQHYGSHLALGQCLFHGGFWAGGRYQVTSRPLSTSLCPQVALRNAEFNAKAYDAGRLDLIVLRISSPAPQGFVFKRKGTKLGHESEVLLPSGVRLKLVAETLVRSDYPAAKYGHNEKAIPVYVLDVEASREDCGQ